MNKLMALLSVLLLLCRATLFSADAEETVFHYYCTASDEPCFPLLQNLIGSIHQEDFDKIDQIAVFDLGMNAEQLTYLAKVEKVAVYPVEMKNPDILKYVARPGGGMVRGWYMWRPVIIKQALEMFPYLLYLDAGTTLLSSPVNLFKHIKENGYFLINIEPHSIEERITQRVLDKVVFPLPYDQQESLLNSKTYMIDEALQGLSRDVYETYLKPVYDLTTDISLFADDGSSKLGNGGGRSDQILFSIYAHLAHLKTNNQGWSFLNVGGKKVPFHMHWEGASVNKLTCLFHSRWSFNKAGERSSSVILINH